MNSGSVRYVGECMVEVRRVAGGDQLGDNVSIFALLHADLDNIDLIVVD